uniref:ATP synthase protein 8 n=1 Tax=Microthoracius praelongiceps TaxID=1958934 RepID=A0A1S5XVR0_9NEOP|nr:ATP synthase protein 8 [Microthoracius praelongiceps]
MPQMSPMFWSFYFIVFIMLLYSSMSMSYFMTLPLESSEVSETRVAMNPKSWISKNDL